MKEGGARSCRWVGGGERPGVVATGVVGDHTSEIGSSGRQLVWNK